MVATFITFMNEDHETLAAPPSPPANAIDAQKQAEEAQKQAESAQQAALAMQAAESGLPSPLNDIEHLRSLAAKVKAADEKIIEHTRPNERS